MEFSWNKQQTELREAIRDFARGSLNEGLIERDREGTFNRAGWDACARMGIHGLCVPEEYGGLGLDALTTVAALEALGEGSRDNGLSFSINAHMWTAEMPLLAFGTPEQKAKYLPRLVSGEWIGGNAMSEPGSGSDAYSLRTTAIRQGDHYVINGSKTFISSGLNCDLVVVVAKTDPQAGAKGVSLILVESDRAGFRKGRKLDKIGQAAADTAELFFDDVRVPVTNRLGEENRGFAYLMQELAQERFVIAVRSAACMEAMFESTVRYVKERKVFGQTLFDFQNSKFKLAEIKSKMVAMRIMVDHYLAEHMKRKLNVEEAAIAKLYCTETLWEGLDAMLQLHGGYGYMMEYPIARAFVDSRVARIYGGTSEVMKELIARGI